MTDEGDKGSWEEEKGEQQVEGDSSRLFLESVKILVLEKGRMTKSRRKAPIPQLQCDHSKVCGSKNELSSLACRNQGLGGDGAVIWLCDTDLPSGWKLSRVTISCEGYNFPSDPYILAGSCGATYSIDLPPADGLLATPLLLSRFVPNSPGVAAQITPLHFIMMAAVAFFLWNRVKRRSRSHHSLEGTSVAIAVPLESIENGTRHFPVAVASELPADPTHPAPCPPSSIPPPTPQELPLPAGWAEQLDDEGEAYFVDHNLRRTTRVDPRIAHHEKMLVQWNEYVSARAEWERAEEARRSMLEVVARDMDGRSEAGRSEAQRYLELNEPERGAAAGGGANSSMRMAAGAALALAPNRIPFLGWLLPRGMRQGYFMGSMVRMFTGSNMRAHHGGHGRGMGAGPRAPRPNGRATVSAFARSTTGR
jgi:hypothetical protein